MRTMPPKKLEMNRVTDGPYASTREMGMTGAWQIVLASGEVANIISSDGMGWDHVSVSMAERCPTWEEMAEVKDLFFEDEECVVEYHPPKSSYVNNHPHCLHLWKPHQHFPRPPSMMVGVKGLSPEMVRAMVGLQTKQKGQ